MKDKVLFLPIGILIHQKINNNYQLLLHTILNTDAKKPNIHAQRFKARCMQGLRQGTVQEETKKKVS